MLVLAYVNPMVPEAVVIVIAEPPLVNAMVILLLLIAVTKYVPATRLPILPPVVTVVPT